MAGTRLPVEQLVRHLLGGATADPLDDELTEWIRGSGRFRAFVETNRDKVRKKLRGATDADSRRDVRTELRVAQLLLRERRVELAFEAYGSVNGGPDFTVTFRGQRPFNLEVTRLHRVPDATHGAPLLAKLRQLPPSMPNAVLIAFDGKPGETFDVAATTQALRSRADAKDEAFFASRGFDGTRGFYRRYLRLGTVLVWRGGAHGDDRITSWSNRSARIAVPEQALRATLACLRDG